MSALSRNGSQGKKRSLDLFHRSSISLKNLLRPCSESPTPGVTNHGAQRSIATSAILGCESSAPAVCIEKQRLKQWPLLKEGDTTPRTYDIASARKGLLDLPDADRRSMEGDTFGIAKEYPHLIDVGAPRQPSREVERYTAHGSSGDHASSGPSVKQEAEQRHYGFASQDTEFSKKKPSPGSGSIRSGYAHLSAANVDSNSQVHSIQAEVLQCELPAMEGSETPHANSRSDPRRATGPPSLKTSYGRPAQPARGLLLHSPKDSAEEEISLDFLPTATCQAGGGESTLIAGSGSPTPTPTIPLPPLPQGHAARRSLFRRSHSPTQETPRTTQIPRRRLGTPTPKSPACRTHNGDTSDDKAPKRTAIKLTANYRRRGLQQPLNPPGRSVVVCEDPFEQRKIRIEKTQALKKRDLEHTRALQQGKERGEDEIYRVTSDFAEDTDDTIILPSVTSAKHSPARSVEALARCSRPDGWGNWTFSTDNDTVVTRRTSPVGALEQEHAPSYRNTRPQYCSHSTQYLLKGGNGSPPEKASLRIPLSPPLSPTQPLSKGPAIQKKVVCPCCERHRQSKPSSAPTEPTAADDPEEFSWYLNDLETRLETRLAAFERRTILLEAALLAVIDASARFGAGGVERRAGRLSVMSKGAEGLAPLESKLEAIIAGINGFVR